MSGNNNASRAQKVARVGIVYSDDERHSAESRNLAHYFCGLLSASGYADIVMIPYSPNGPVVDFPSKRILYIPPGEQKPREVPGSDVSFSHWNVLTTCHLVLVTVNGHESRSCGSKLAQTLQNHKNIPIFALQRGVKNTAALSEEAEAKGNTVIEGVVGFSVVLDPKFSAFVSTVRHPGVMYCRLTKEEVAVADVPLRVLETMNLDVSFRKILTPFSFGVALFENLYALNVVTKGSLSDTIDNYDNRQILALMMRECSQALTAASKGGTWSPSLHLISSLLNPKLFEFLLLLPNPLFQMIYWLLGLYPVQPLMSPGQQDLTEGRKTMTTATLTELVETARRYQVMCPVMEHVLQAIQSVESPLDAAVPVHSYHSAELLSALQIALKYEYPSHDSVAELRYYVVRFVGILSVVVLLIFLFMHE